ncbi:MAG: 2-hydroxyacid dehydrogenase [Alphaproteobacteria bacterium]
MPTVAFAGTFAANLLPRVRARVGTEFSFITGSEAEIGARMADVDVLVSMAFTAAMARAASKLKLVQVPGAGLDLIERDALPARTMLANAYGHETGIAEYVFGAVLSLMRELPRLDDRLRRGEWRSHWSVGRPPPTPWPELAGKSLGIVGFGRIGKAVARRARAFDMTVRGIRRNPAPDPDLAFCGGPDALDEVLRQADGLLISAELGPQTRGLIGARELALLPPGAVLVNVARAEIVDQQALYAALKGGQLGGAALDVWYRYPTGPGPTSPADLPFHELPNVLMTPHASGWTEGMMANRAATIAENIERAMRGAPPLNHIAPDS